MGQRIERTYVNDQGMTTEVVNLSFRDDGCLQPVLEPRNAVIIQYFAHEDENGEVVWRRAVSVECKDNWMLMKLLAEAKRLAGF